MEDYSRINRNYKAYPLNQHLQANKHYYPHIHPIYKKGFVTPALSRKLLDLGDFEPMRLLSPTAINKHIVIGNRHATIITDYENQLSATDALIDKDDDECFMCCDFAFKDIELLLLAGHCGIIKVFDFVNLKFMYTMKNHGGAINALKVDKYNRNIIYTGSEDTSIRMWDINTRQVICIFGGIAGHRDQILSLDLSLCGQYLVSSSYDSTVKVWSLPEKCDLCQLYGAKNHICGSSGDILMIHYPIFSSSEFYGSFINCIRFFGEFLIAKGNSNRIVVFKPVYKAAILHSYENCECFLIDEKILETSNLTTKFFIDYRLKRLLIGRRDKRGEFFACNLEFDQDSNKISACNSNVDVLIRDITSGDGYLYILYDDNKFEKIQF